MSKQAKESSDEEFKLIEQQLLRDIAILIHKASETILESNILKTFYEGLNKKRPTDIQIKTLKKSLFECIVGKFPKFEDAIELIVERDECNDKVVVIEFNPKKIKIKADPDFAT
jgi:hypothetical protein